MQYRIERSLTYHKFFLRPKCDLCFYSFRLGSKGSDLVHDTSVLCHSSRTCPVNRWPPLNSALPLLLFFSSVSASFAEPMLIDGKAADRQQSTSQTGALKGEVQQTSIPTRLPRTGLGFPTKDFKHDATVRQSAPGNLLPAQTPIMAPVPSILNTLTVPGQTSSDGKIGDPADSKSSTGTGTLAVESKAPPAQKTVVIRIRRVVSMMEAEIAESALKTALSMLKKDPDTAVIVFLDLDAVSLADGQFNYYDQLGTGEDGNLRVISIKFLRSQLEKFGDEGGRIVVSERWAKIRGFHRNTNTIVRGAVLTDEEGIAQLLLEAGNVIDY